jgi:methyl-accepting chemotaxis protein
MFRRKLLYKVVGITGLTLLAGFTAMGFLSLWLEYQAVLKLQVDNNKNLAAIVTKNITDAMMRGEARDIASYVTQMKEKRLFRDLTVFNSQGVEATAPDAGKNNDIVKAMAAGVSRDQVLAVGDSHLLSSLILLPCEERCVRCHGSSTPVLGAIMLTTSLDSGYASAQKLTLLLTGAGAFFFFLIIFSMILFFKSTIVNNVLACAATVKQLSEGKGDLTTKLPVRSDDEIGQLAAGINRLTGTLRDTISDLYRQTEQTAVAICRVDRETMEMVTVASSQKEQSTSLAVAAEEMATTLNEVAANTHRATKLSRQVDGAAGAGMAAVAETFTCMETISGTVMDTLKTVERLAASSGTIGEITTLIEDIADQTSLLSLNAAIEAARAGEHGRGFAVVADEVKSLSSKTASSTREISQIIRNIQTESTAAIAAMFLVRERVEEGVAKSVAARDSLGDILTLSGDASEMINQIACTTEEQSVTTADISMRVLQVSELASRVHSQMQTNEMMFRKLAQVAEQVFSTVGNFRVGNKHDEMKGYADELRQAVVTVLEKALSNGSLTFDDLFDRTYHPLHGTSPQKFTTSFDNFFDREILPLQEKVLAKESALFFAICIDDHGYVPTHNRRYSQPLTGNPELDKVNNRTKRIFDDRTGLRAAVNLEPYLLQTYMRDTGEIMNDISTPILLQGRHWGAVRVGYHCLEEES